MRNLKSARSVIPPGRVIVAPSILSADFSRLGAEIKKVERAGAKWLHIDVMDGRFVPNLSVGPPVIKSLRRAAKIFFDVHLMIERPSMRLDDYLAAGADAVTFHLESERPASLRRLLAKTRKAGALAGVSIKPATPASALEKFAGAVDLVLLMSVEPGFGGQSFIKSSTAKVRAVRRMLDRLNPRAAVSVDGGINAANAAKVVAAGAGVLVAGNSVFGHPSGAAAGFSAVSRAALSAVRRRI